MQSAHRYPSFTARRCVLFVALMQGFAAYAQNAVSAPPPADTAGNATVEAQSNAAQKAAKPAKASVANATQLGAVTVTAEKKTENIQVVPIAITALSGQDLDDRKIETGADLVRAVPNVSFTKTNFASYNFQIRGIGTQALSVTTDPAVAVSFNDTPLIRNRLFEQEYFDVNNVEILRGPQGTLYGRNATAGVVNMIPNLPTFDGFESWIKAETGNYDGKRFSGMVNIPLSNTLAFRLAGAWTDRSGYMYNSANNTDVDGRNLWSGRMSLAWKPTEGINATLVWEHFNENDNRARTGKQLCNNDPGPDSVDGVTPSAVDRNFMSQGCADGSLYGRNAFGVPNGASLPQVLALGTTAGVMGGTNPNVPPNFTGVNTYIPYGTDPYAGVTQSTNLRQIATSYDPVFRAKNDVVQFNFDAKVGDHLKFVSQTLFTRDSYYSTQDYSRFQSNPVFTPSDGFVNYFGDPIYQLTPGGVYNDPQLGKSNRFLEVDLTTSKSHQFSQEFRLQSSNDGPFNFSVGVNYLDFKIDEDYYVFNNAFSLLSENFFNTAMDGRGTQPVNCPQGQKKTGDFMTDLASCVYIDPNPLASINGNGHNYFRSRNSAETKSQALFGEGYWQLADEVKLTAGLRYTRDYKTTTPYPSQLLLKPGIFGGGLVNSGYPASPDIKQQWGEFTGRLVLDWKPQLSFTDSTLFYTSYSRGYKAGGTNSPGIGADPEFLGFSQHPSTFKPEFINAFELGTKNTLAGGKMTLNADVFYYNYKNYQVSQIEDRATLNENFNAKTWGAEVEAAWIPTRELRFDGTLGLLGTRIDSNQYSIDVMNRTQSNPDWVIMRPWIQQASNCIAPAALVAQVLKGVYSETDPNANNGGNAANILYAFCPYSPALLGNQLGNYGVNYNPLTDAPNQGQGFSANVGGKSLPNAPKVTFNFGAQYTFFFSHSNLTARADYYHQSASWARVYNDPIDRLQGYGNVNLSLSYDRTDTDLTVQLYVKNVLNNTPITGTFLNSDDSNLTSNVFTLDPRIIGLSIRKGFD